MHFGLVLLWYMIRQFRIRLDFLQNFCVLLRPLARSAAHPQLRVLRGLKRGTVYSRRDRDSTYCTVHLTSLRFKSHFKYWLCGCHWHHHRFAYAVTMTNCDRGLMPSNIFINSSDFKKIGNCSFIIANS